MITLSDVNGILERATEPTWQISPGHHGKAIEVAVERARAEMFAACVKEACWMCGNGNMPVLITGTTPHIYIHKPSTEFGRCKAEAIRLAFPLLSEQLNAAK